MKLEWSITEGGEFILRADGEMVGEIQPLSGGMRHVLIWERGGMFPSKEADFDRDWSIADLKVLIEREVTR